MSSRGGSAPSSRRRPLDSSHGLGRGGSGRDRAAGPRARGASTGEEAPPSASSSSHPLTTLGPKDYSRYCPGEDKQGGYDTTASEPPSHIASPAGISYHESSRHPHKGSASRTDATRLLGREQPWRHPLLPWTVAGPPLPWRAGSEDSSGARACDSRELVLDSSQRLWYNAGEIKYSFEREVQAWRFRCG